MPFKEKTITKSFSQRGKAAPPPRGGLLGNGNGPATDAREDSGGSQGPDAE